MTNDKDKLQKIFEAALKEADSPPAPAATRRAVPTQPKNPADPSATAVDAPPQSRPIDKAPTDKAIPDTSQKTSPPIAVISTPAIDAAHADELGKALDEKLAKETRKRKRGALITVVTFFAIIGGSIAWFTSSPDRVNALRSALDEVDSVTDVTGILDSYKSSFSKVGSRNQDLKDITKGAGFGTEVEKDDSIPTKVEDVKMDDEIKSLIGN